MSRGKMQFLIIAKAPAKKSAYRMRFCIIKTTGIGLGYS
jgi:hypothetical protein